MYLVYKKYPCETPKVSVYKNLQDAQKEAVSIKGRLFQEIPIKNYSRFEFSFDEDSVFDEQTYINMGWSEGSIDNLRLFEGRPRFFIKNLDNENDARGCGPEGWYNSMEYCYDCPEGVTEQQGREYLLGLGMKEEPQ